MDCRLCKLGKLAAWGVTIVLLFGFGSSASAQVFTGRIDVTVEDSTGGRLPGVSVDLTGPSIQTQVTDPQGLAHFLNLPVGTYKLTANLSGFNLYTNSDVAVGTGAATSLMVRLGVAGTAETVNVTAATPIVDIKRETTTTNITLDELQNIPTARDPWVVMQTVPTIYVDRVNVGGSESGQQSNYMGKGSYTNNNTWSIDGVPVTDMGATGSTPTYYDFDMFQEMSITTGGADAQNPTPGVQLNLVLKKGVNAPHADARYYYENQSLEGNNVPQGLAQLLNAQRVGAGSLPLSADCVASNFTAHCGNRTDSYKDYGFDLGGPILKDKLWGWGTIGETHPRILTITGSPDETILKNYALKVDGQMNPNVRGNFTFFEGNKQKFGRSAGPTRPSETSWDQSGPTKYYKGEGNFVVGQNFFVAARYAYISGGFSLTPEGGNVNFYQDDNAIWHNSYYGYSTVRPQYYGAADASYFSGKHELKFGFSYRRTPVDSVSSVSGNGIVTFWNTYPDLTAQATENFVQSNTGKYAQAFVTDTISLNRLTLIGGVRFDHQTSSYNGGTAPAVAGFGLLPAVTGAAVSNAYDFNNVTPRVGITYALDDSRKTIARASYSVFASQLPGNAASFISPIQPSTYVSYNAVDRQTNGQPCTPAMAPTAANPGGLNGCDGIAELSEILFNQGVQGSKNVDVAHPGVFTTTNTIGSISAPRTQEVLLGMDRELMPNFGVSATFTYRYSNNFLWNPPNGVTPASYVQTGTFTTTVPNNCGAYCGPGTLGTVNVPVYGATSVLPGFNAQNWPDYHQRYLGFELSATKRMSNHWMARLGFATTSWNEYFGSSNAILDRTPTPTGPEGGSNSGGYSNYGSLSNTGGPLINGGPVAVETSGSGKSNIYLLPPKYQITANGMYQLPWGINAGANLVLRQGYGAPFYRSRVNTHDAAESLKQVLLTNGDDQFRLSPVTSFDVRAEWMPSKAFHLQRVNFAVDLDVFNAFNNATILGYQYDARSSAAYNSPQEIMQPRIARIGVRFFF
jgi:hypothetical protein